MLNRANLAPVEPAVPAAFFRHSQAIRLPLQASRYRGTGGFTLIELLVAIGVLVLLILLATQLLNSAATITRLGHKQMDADSQARQLLDRMALDVAQMVRRQDVDYYMKSTQAGTPDCTTCEAQAGNDRIAFFASTSGYYPTPSYQSPVSLIAYRVNSDSNSSSSNKLERMGKGFVWNGVASIYKPILFLDNASTPSTTIQAQWSAAVSGSTTDPDYEVIGPQVFRFEYYYLLRTGSFSAIPWNSGAGHTNVSGMRDVAAIVADIAVIDSKSRVILTDAQIATLNTSGAANFLSDYTAGMTPGQLRANWQTTLNANASLPRAVLSGIRIYERFIYLSPPTI
jgi:prepilin-type N-terminal cleavage/methylation domain-containing protein